VNNDTEFSPGLVQKLVDILDTHPQVGIISPKLVYDFDRSIIQYVGFTQVDYIPAATRPLVKTKKMLASMITCLAKPATATAAP
jgi:GT2 family glycosyltransferase